MILIDQIGIAVLGAGLIALAIIDIRSFRLPDWLTFPLLLAGLIYAFLNDRLAVAVLGAIVGYCLFRLIDFLYRRFRQRDGLGQGDAKLLAVGGAWCGFASLGTIVLISAIGGICWLFAQRYLFGNRSAFSNALPFGPFLGIAIFVTLFLQTI